MGNKYVGFGKKLFDLAKGESKSKVATTVVGVTPKVNKTVLDKAKSKLAITTQKAKASKAKLNQTTFEIANKAFKGKDDFTFATTNKKTPSNTELKKAKKEKKQENKTKHFYAPKDFNKGGRVGLKFGSKKSNVQKIQETFGPKKKLSPKQMKIAKLAGNPKKIDAQDLAKLRGRG